MKRQLPESLTNSFVFSGVSDSERMGFEGRLQYIEEIVQGINDWAAKDNRQSELRHFFDDLELDVATVQSLPDSNKGVSTWLIHSSWATETDSAELRKQIDKDIVDAINGVLPKVESNSDAYKNWLFGQGAAVATCLDQFYSATVFPNAVANLIAVDALLANIQAGLIRFRLSTG